VITEVKHSISLVTNPENFGPAPRKSDLAPPPERRWRAGNQIARHPREDRDLANCVYPRQRRRALLNEGIELV
jgi:hypothetical protein